MSAYDWDLSYDEWPLGQLVRAISDLIDGTYQPDLDREAHLFRRVMKVAEETGEVTEALFGTLGENPRKGRTHTLDDVRSELMDVALAALAACAHIDTSQDHGAAFAWHAMEVYERLGYALDWPQMTTTTKEHAMTETHTLSTDCTCDPAVEHVPGPEEKAARAEGCCWQGDDCDRVCPVPETAPTVPLYINGRLAAENVLPGSRIDALRSDIFALTVDGVREQWSPTRWREALVNAIAGYTSAGREPDAPGAGEVRGG